MYDVEEKPIDIEELLIGSDELNILSLRIKKVVGMATRCLQDRDVGSKKKGTELCRYSLESVTFFLTKAEGPCHCTEMQIRVGTETVYHFGPGFHQTDVPADYVRRVHAGLQGFIAELQRRFPQLPDRLAPYLERDVNPYLSMGIGSRGVERLPEEFKELTYVVEHNPNCPSPFLVRLCGRGQGKIDHKYPGESKDALGYGKTLTEAGRKALEAAEELPQ